MDARAWVRVGPGGWLETCQQHVATHYLDEQGKLVKVDPRKKD